MVDISGVKTDIDCEKFVIFDEKVRLVEDMMRDWIRTIEEVVKYKIIIKVINVFSYKVLF